MQKGAVLTEAEKTPHFVVARNGGPMEGGDVGGGVLVIREAGPGGLAR